MVNPSCFIQTSTAAEPRGTHRVRHAAALATAPGTVAVRLAPAIGAGDTSPTHAPGSAAGVAKLQRCAQLRCLRKDQRSPGGRGNRNKQKKTF
eukprot:s1310_g3.t1